MAFGGFGPGFFGGFGGFGPGGFGGGGGGVGGGSAAAFSGGSSHGHSHSASSIGSFDKGGYSGGPYGVGDVKPSVSDRSLPNNMAPSGGSSGGAYDNLPNLAGAYGYGPFSGGFGGFPIGEWSQFSAVGGIADGASSGDYQIGNYSQVNSSYGPANRLGNRGVSAVDKNNRGYRPY